MSDEVEARVKNIADGLAPEDREDLIALVRRRMSERKGECERETEEPCSTILTEFIRQKLTEPTLADQSFMKASVNAVEAMFASEKWAYSKRNLRDDMVLFELGFGLKTFSVRVRIWIEDNPRFCRIVGILPISGDPRYEYLLCTQIVKMNYDRRLGVFQYNAPDREVSFKYAYPIERGVHGDELKQVLLSILNSVSEDYEEVRRHCAGRLKGNEAGEVLVKIDALVKDLSDK